MGRPATGQVIERPGKRGATFAIRFTTAGGQRRQVRLGTAAEGWTRRRADEELQAVLADLRRGHHNNLAAPPEDEKPDPLFAEFALEWFERVRDELGANTVLDYEWQLKRHLMPHFGPLPLSGITAHEVDRYRQAQVAEARRRREAIAAGRPLVDREGRVLRPLSATSINKTLTRLAQILEVAFEYELIQRNPAKGKNRRLKAPKYRGTCLDGAAEIEALLAAAGALDAEGRVDPHRRALLTVLTFGGLRIDEALSLRWRHVSLPARKLRIASAKTDAGVREGDLLPVVADELVTMRARSGGAMDALVFGTSTGGKRTPSGVRNRLLARAVELADVELAKADLPPLPEPLTPHSLRRTFASVLFALGEPVPYVMDQMGHTDPQVTLGIYARVMRRSGGEKERLKALVEGVDVSARLGATSGSEAPAAGVEASA